MITVLKLCHTASLKMFTFIYTSWGLGQACATVGLWLSEDNLRDLALSFHHVSSRDTAKGIGLGGKHLYQLRQLTVPIASYAIYFLEGTHHLAVLWPELALNSWLNSLPALTS